MGPKWPDNKKIPSNNNEIDIVDENVISSVQIAALNETTDRATSKPNAVIDGQNATGGGGTSTPHVLGTNVDTTTGPFLSQHADNVAKFTDLYNNNTAKFPAYNTVEEFLSAVLGQPLAESVDVSCVFVPNANNAQTAGVWTWSDVVQFKPFGTPISSRFTDKWFIPEGLFIKILETSDASLNSMAAFKALSSFAQKALTEDKTLMNPFLPTALQDTYAIKNLNAATGFQGGNQNLKGSIKITGDATNPGEFDGTNDNLWWTTIEEYVRTMAKTDTTLRLSPDAPCIGGGYDKNIGWKVETTTVTTHGTPMVVADDKIEVDSSVLDPDNLPSPAQFTIDVPWDPVLLSNLATIFTDPNDYTLLTGDIKVEVLKTAVSTAVGSDAPPSIITYADKRPVELDSSGDPEGNQYDEESVIPAINRIHRKTNQALASAGVLDQYLTTTVIGNPNASNPGQPGDVEYDALSAAGYDPTLTIALGRLNLIPILSGDRLIEAVPKLDSDGNQVYTDLGVPETVFITQEQRAEMTPESRRERLMLHPDSDTPPTKMLEALWTNWRHISALTTDTYGISALTDINILDDKHTLISELSSNSFIENFNTLYNTNISLSGDLQLVIDAISGSNRTDSLIEQLSSYSIYENLNTIYTGMSANSACCDVTTTTLSTHTAAISSLSSYVVSLDKKIGTGGGISTCEGDDICSTLTDLHDTLINLQDPGGYTLEIPAGFPKRFKPHDEYVLDGSLCDNEVKPNSPIYKYYQDIQGAAPDVRYLWQHPDNSWRVGEKVCDTDLTITNPNNLELSALTLFNKPVLRHESPYREFTERINKIVEFIDNPPNPVDDEITELSACCDSNSILLSSIGTDIMQLSSCCSTNTLTLSSLSSFVYGEPPTQVAPGLSGEGDVISIVNKLYTSIINLEEGGGGDFSEHVENILKNQFNINILSGGVDIINTNINELSSSVIDLEECCDTSLKIGDLDTHAVLLTGSQSVSGEKTFEHTLTVSTSANVGELITVGQGESVFYVCTDESDVSHVVMPLVQLDPVDLSSLPDGAVYARSTADGKQLMIK